MTDLLRILIAPLVWLAAFSAIYGLHGLICGHGIGIAAPPLPRLLLIGAFALAIAVQGAVLVALHARRLAPASDFVRFTSRATGWVGLVAAVWTLFPVAVTTHCQ